MWSYVFFFAVSAFLQIYGAPTGNIKVPEIYNGNTADPSKYRYMIWIKRNGAFICGGALLKKRFAITAAQCVERPGMYQVVVGDYDRTSIEGTEQTIDVEEVRLHPEWNRFTLDNDIAILKLASAANINSTSVSKVLNLSNATIDQEIMMDRSSCVVTGWGYTTFNGVWMLGPLLQELPINIQNNSRCSEILLGSYNPITRLCFENVDSGTCSGDNGGPWMCRTRGYGWALVGIHSYGVLHDGCRSGGRAGTRVSYYTDWIAENVYSSDDSGDEGDPSV